MNTTKAQAKINGKQFEWDVNIKVLERSEHFINTTITAMGSEFNLIVVCTYTYLHGVIQDWALLLPGFNIGCPISKDKDWNEEKLCNKIKNKIDRSSIIAAIDFLLN